jgi:hypothetical protein
MRIKAIRARDVGWPSSNTIGLFLDQGHARLMFWWFHIVVLWGRR